MKQIKNDYSRNQQALVIITNHVYFALVWCGSEAKSQN